MRRDRTFLVAVAIAMALAVWAADRSGTVPTEVEDPHIVVFPNDTAPNDGTLHEPERRPTPRTPQLWLDQLNVQPPDK